jgi:hypothetical protein
MSDQNPTQQLPDEVFGSATGGPGINLRRLNINTNQTPQGTLYIHAHIGGMHVAMTEANWRALFNAIQQVNIPVPTYRIDLEAQVTA